MTNYVITKSAEILSVVRSDMKEANREYTSISRVLKDIQRSDLMRKGFAACFEAVGIEKGHKVEPAEFFAAVPVENWVEARKGREAMVGIWGLTTKKDEQGNVVKDAEGNEVKVPVLRAVSSWTPRKVFLVLAQAKVAREVAEAEKRVEEEKKAKAEKKAQSKKAAKAA